MNSLTPSPSANSSSSSFDNEDDFVLNNKSADDGKGNNVDAMGYVGPPSTNGCIVAPPGTQIHLPARMVIIVDSWSSWSRTPWTWAWFLLFSWRYATRSAWWRGCRPRRRRPRGRTTRCRSARSRPRRQRRPRRWGQLQALQSRQLGKLRIRNSGFKIHMINLFEIRSNRRRSKKAVPDEKKDDIYWKRRLKNNLAAKRSRETRRKKEMELTDRASYLEQQNEILKYEPPSRLRDFGR